jgi:hypothetical protein
MVEFSRKESLKIKRSRKMFSRIKSALFLFVLVFFAACSANDNNPVEPVKPEKKIGVLLVNHGSRSATWRQALLDLETSVKDSLLYGGLIKGTKTAFMEYNEPSIATRLKEFDAEAYTDVILVPIFLTVSPHSFEDIPTIIGQKEDPQSLEMLKIEKIERYTPKAKAHITPLLDFTNILEENVLRRVKSLSKNPQQEGLVLIGYGDEAYEKEWSDLFNTVAEKVKEQTGIDYHAYGWCGHIAHYQPDSTTKAIQRVLSVKETAVVIPVLVAHDEQFQIQIIGDGIKAIPQNESKVLYKPDAILPDPNVASWVIQIAREYAEKIQNGTLK